MVLVLSHVCCRARYIRFLYVNDISVRVMWRFLKEKDKLLTQKYLKKFWQHIISEWRQVDKTFKYIRDKPAHEWDVTLLFTAITKCHVVRMISQSERDDLESLKDIRNEHVGHVRIRNGMTADLYKKKVKELTTLYKRLLGQNAQKFITEAERCEHSKKNACTLNSGFSML